MAKEAKTNAMRILERNKVEYKVDTYEASEFTDGVHSAEILGHDVDRSFKTLVATGKSGEHYVFVLPVAAEVDFKAAAKAVGEKNVELIHVKELTPLTGYIRGGCSPLGMKKQFRTVIDSTAETFDTIYISGGRVGCTIELSPADLIRVVRADVADIEAK
ncbi:Cys-tRNA(Pro)/Cys-tRNA(Cys) deacylase [Lachnospiraceae bacterium]|nr:Cys-tRNA(Pro)/Cys-tRNA(Cys) deacylase [Lachnospiraceae bacterium]